MDEVGIGLEVNAETPEDIIEAFISSDHPWLIEVETQPEKTAASEPSQQHLSGELV